MELLLERVYTSKTYTIGHLYELKSNGDKEQICDTIEDCDRGLTSSMSLDEIMKIKIQCQTAIPTGKYQITLNVTSPSFGKKPYYQQVCNGKLPRLLDVKGFDGILIHRGVDESHSCGCIIVGYNNVKGKVMDSKIAFEKLLNKLYAHKSEKIYITIANHYR